MLSRSRQKQNNRKHSSPFGDGIIHGGAQRNADDVEHARDHQQCQGQRQRISKHFQHQQQSCRRSQGGPQLRQNCRVNHQPPWRTQKMCESGLSFRYPTSNHSCRVSSKHGSSRTGGDAADIPVDSQADAGGDAKVAHKPACTQLKEVCRLHTGAWHVRVIAQLAKSTQSHIQIEEIGAVVCHPRYAPTTCIGMYCTSVASFLLPTAMMHRPTTKVASASHVSAVPIATSRLAPSAVHNAAIDVAMAL